MYLSQNFRYFKHSIFQTIKTLKITTNNSKLIDQLRKKRGIHLKLLFCNFFSGKNKIEYIIVPNENLFFIFETEQNAT